MQQLSLFNSQATNAHESAKPGFNKSSQVTDKSQFAKLLLSKLDGSESASETTLTGQAQCATKSAGPASTGGEIEAIIALQRQQQHQSNQIQDLITAIQDPRI